MAPPTQDGRPFRLETPLGKDVLLLVRWHGEEYVSRLFQFTVEAWSEQPDIDVQDLLLKPVSLIMELPTAGAERTIGGIVTRFVNLGLSNYGLTAYQLEIMPPHWMLTVGRTFEIFQEKPVPEILDKVFDGFDVSKELSDSYNKRQYCFQYRESKFAFASRLMEQEGIWYRFDHTASPPKLVMASGNSAARVEWGLSEVLANRTDDVEERLLDVSLVHAPYVGKTQTRTYSEFLMQKNMREEASAIGGSKRFKPPAALLEYVFDQQLAAHRQGVTPGGSDDSGNLQLIFPENERNAKLRQEAEETRGLRLFGTTTHRGLTAGAKVTVARHDSASVNKAWMVLSVHHRGDNGGYIGGDLSNADYENRFEALPHDVPFRPARTTPWPRVGGTHVGIVVGPAGEEIFPDKYGRVHVCFRFHDDYEQNLEHSCWIRMAQVFAGPNYGSVFLPRIGHEVLVDFLDGNPDNPIIVGQLYSDHNMPPWPLPENKTQSGFRTRSTLNGGSDEHNELRFEDKKGEEQIWVQAQKDLDTLVKNNETREVRNDRTTVIVQHDTRTVNKGNDSHTIEEGDQFNEVTKGSQFVTIGSNQVSKIQQNQDTTVYADQKWIVEGKQDSKIKDDRIIEVTEGNSKLTVKEGNIDTKATAGEIMIEAGQKIVLKVGGSTISIENSGITIKGPTVTMKGDGAVEIDSPSTKVSGSGMLTLKGGVTMIN
jgi:type VI secretion system secreted protein VgrG